MSKREKLEQASLCLANMDEGKMNEALEVDTTRLFEKILYPPSFPWTHHIVPVSRNLPCDIDDFHIFRLQDALDSSDPNASVRDPGLLRAQLGRRTAPLSVSVRLGGSSSRSDILGVANDRERLPLLLASVLPKEVVNGRHLTVTHTAEVATYLGSYDHRFGLPPQGVEGAEQRSRPKRSICGRTRRMWTQAQIYEESGRHLYTSLLSDEKLAGGRHKRPRIVRVGIRLNSKLICGDYAQLISYQTAMDNALSHAQDMQLSYDEDIVEASIESSISKEFSGSRRLDLNQILDLESDGKVM